MVNLTVKRHVIRVDGKQARIIMPPPTSLEERLRWGRHKGTEGLFDFSGGWRCSCHLEPVKRGAK